MKTLEAKLKENEVNIWKEKYNHIIMKKEIYLLLVRTISTCFLFLKITNLHIR